MGYLLRMSDEIRDWLDDLRDSEPVTARQVGAALTALISEGASLAAPLVIALESPPAPSPAGRPEAAALIKDIERQVAELEARQAQLGDQRWQALQEGRPEAAAQAVDELAMVQDQLAELRRLSPRATGADRGAAGDDAQTPDDTAAGLEERIAQIERELRAPMSAEGLMELRPGAPGHSDIRILFAVEPPGTALLIAVLEGRDAVEERRGEAVELSAEVLRRARAGQAPEAAAQAFDDVPSFLDEFFPGSADDVETAGAALAARNRAGTLAAARSRLDLTREDVARRMGVRPGRVAAIEQAEPGATEVRTLAAYVEALGGRLEIIADFGEERVVLR
ncbi:MAG TPA: helix-turn-helix transcriptional regulator [Streptosporangiaceae bacterium]|nr:helix-turn-helix transcriptional regulator [Streptosporangiaceae bacterium]